MSKKTSNKIALTANLIILAIFCFFLLDFFGIVGSKNEITIRVENGDNPTTVSQKLKDEKIINSTFLFKTFFKLGVYDNVIKPGEFTVSSNMAYKEIVERIKHINNETNSVTIPEGFTNDEIIDRLINNEIISDKKEFEEALKNYSFSFEGIETNGNSNSLNGYLFPDTYEFYHDSIPKDVIKKMTENFVNHCSSEYAQRAKDLGMSFEDVVILASIIQREAKYEDDFYTVSSVFHNRLKIDMKLQSCATVQYILKERKAVLSVADTKIDSPYNTYKYAGLPPTAICSPGELAIKAALYPDNTDYLYFFTDKNGDTHFSKTLNEHNSLMGQYPLQ